MGNVRVSFGRKSAGVLEIADANDYYPFGMNHLKTVNAFFGAGSYKSYKFLGQELQETGFYDMNARFYMADLGKFGTHDPLSASTLDPYGYGYNNPIMFADPTGLEGDPVNGSGGAGGPVSPASFGDTPGGYDGAPQLMAGAGANDVAAEQRIQGIVLNGSKGTASNSASAMPTNCIACSGGSGMSPGITLPQSNVRSEDIAFKPVLHNGSAMMMDGLLWDVAGIYIANNVKPENRYAAMGVTLLAALITRSPSVIKIETGIAKAELAVEKSVLNTEINVVRGGTCLACQFENGSGVTVNANGLLNGVSVNSVEGLSIKELSAGIPNGKIGTTTVSQIEAFGGKVIASPTKNNPFHSTLSGITAQQAEKLFNPTIKNPLK